MKNYRVNSSARAGRSHRTSERDVYIKVIGILQKKKLHISGITKKKDMLHDGEHADIVVMLGNNRYVGIKFKGECVPLTREEMAAQAEKIYTVVRSEDDLYDMLGSVACGKCGKQ